MRRIGRLPWPAALALALAAVALGLTAERFGFGWDDPRHWVPDLIVGWTFIWCGLVASARRPANPSGLLMTATGLTWFLGNFSHVGVAMVSSAAATSLYLHRGPLVHLVLTYPSGRTRSWLVRSAIAVGYVVSIIRPTWQNRILTIVLGSLIVAVTLREYLRAVGRSRRARLMSLRAAAIFGLLLIGEAAVRLALPIGRDSEPLLLGYEVGLCALAVILLVGLLSTAWERAVVTDLVVELGEARSGTLRGELARALGDPTLDVGFWLPDAEAFVDAEGRPLPLPDADARRSVTMIEREGQKVAALVHDPAVLEDPGLLDAVSSATQLAVSNARLQADVRAQLTELEASRRRILDAGDAERERLARRLHQGAEQRLEGLRAKLRAARGSALADDTRERIEKAEAQLGQALEELAELAQGLHPRILSEAGLAGALTEVAERSTVSVQLVVLSPWLPPSVEAAVYFVCSEALANVGKYASASRVVVSVTTLDGRVVVEVQDDGIGGADINRGSGLRGLADRIEALGGSIRLDSPPGQGTRLTAEIPFATEAARPSPTSERFEAVPSS
jgi:signal transduction histidine kinase